MSRRVLRLAATRKANQPMELFLLGAYRSAPFSTYSNGMQQRRDLGAIVSAPARGTGKRGQDYPLHLVLEVLEKGKLRDLMHLPRLGTRPRENPRNGHPEARPCKGNPSRGDWQPTAREIVGVMKA